jgi:dTDP-4-amino-4,6-dideoxygalactose transaminase
MNQFYQALFNDIDGITVFKEPAEDYFSNFWLSCIIIDSKITGFNRESLRLHLEKSNIESRPLWKPMHLQPIFNDSPYYGENVAETLFENGLCLPSGSNLTDVDRERIKKSILNIFNK